MNMDFEGKTTQDAIRTALKKLNLPRHRVSIKVLSEEKKGLFGLAGERPAKIRVTLKGDR